MYIRKLSGKSSFKTLFIAVVALVVLAAPIVWSASQSAEAAPPRQGGDVSGQQSITVTGYGVAYGAPDIARVSLGVEVSDQDVMTAMNTVSARMDAVLQALQASGVAREDIRTERFSIYQDYGYGPMGPADAGDQPAPYYRVSTAALVTVRDIDTVAELLQSAVEAGANMINYVEFDIEDRASLQSEARGSAVDDARARAEELAAMLGVEVGDVLSVVEGGDYYMPQGLGGGGGGPAMDMAGAPAISQGMLSVNMSITITFALVG